MLGNRFGIFPQDDPNQELRLRRFFLGAAGYLLNTAFVVICWQMGYFGAQVVMSYMVLMSAVNVFFYAVIRSNLNKRFADPSLTAPQMAVAALIVLNLMYFAGDSRSTFLLLVLTMLLFGLFRFKTRDFLYLGAFILSAYATLIALLQHMRPHEIDLKVEILQWMALFVTLLQFIFLAGYIGNLRRKVRENNQALAERNVALEAALQRISDMAVRDDLTGVYNRRYLTERIVEEAQRNTRNGSVFSICMIDIDWFKQINDTYGHQAGDAVLRVVAATASDSLRTTDFFGRFGGEEFVMVLTDTPGDGALNTAERVRQKIAQLSFPEIDAALKVTVSIGISEHVRKSETSATFKKADDALYRAKESGRNNCTLAQPE